MDGSDIACKACKMKVKFEDGYFNCGIPSCNFNICRECFTLKPVECENHHPLSTKFSKKISISHSGQYYGETGRYKCDNCHVNKTDGKRVTCSESTCDFDICPDCALCPSGHILRVKK